MILYIGVLLVVRAGCQATMYDKDYKLTLFVHLKKLKPRLSDYSSLTTSEDASSSPSR